MSCCVLLKYDIKYGVCFFDEIQLEVMFINLVDVEFFLCVESSAFLADI
jgi:hypothetical protein